MNRRHFLQQMAASGLFFSPMIRIARAESSNQLPKRLMIFHTSNGVPTSFMPTGAETSFTLSSVLQPLAAHRSDILFTKGIAWRGAHLGCHHGPGTLLTGMKCNGGEKGQSKHANISVDQFIADELQRRAGRTRLHSLQLAASDGDSRKWAWADYRLLSARGPDLAIVPELNPQSAFNRVFSGFNGGGGGGGGTDPQIARRRDVLAAVFREIQTLRSNLSGSERQKLEQHAAAIEQIQRTLDGGGGSVTGCTVPGNPGTWNSSNIYANNTFRTRFDAMIDISIQSLACNLTQVVVLGAEGGQGNVVFDWLGLSGEHHEVHSHSDNGSSWQTIYKWYAEKFAQMITKLKSVREGNGTLLDQTALVWINDMGPGVHKESADLPIIIAGKCGGYFRTGRYASVGSGSLPGFLFNLMRAMDVQSTSMGGISGSPLSNLS